jgi:hypothetical protein
MSDRDIHLRYKFTDRGGSNVYDAYTGEDRLKQDTVLFIIRIHPDGDIASKIEWPEDDQQELKL